MPPRSSKNSSDEQAGAPAVTPTIITDKPFSEFYYEGQSQDAKYEERKIKTIFTRQIHNIEFCNDHIKIYPDLYLVNEFVYLIDANNRVLANELDLYYDTKKLSEMTTDEYNDILTKSHGKIHDLLGNCDHMINYSRVRGIHWRLPKPKDGSKKDSKYFAHVCELNIERCFMGEHKWVQCFVR